MKASGAVAIMFTQAGTVDYIKVIPIKGRYFRCKYGTYFLDFKRRYTLSGTSTTILIYDTKLPYPISVEAAKRIQMHLALNGRYQLQREVVAVNHEEYTRELGRTTMKFLGDLQRTDLAVILNLMDHSLQSDKKMPISPALSDSPITFLEFFNMAGKARDMAFIFVDNSSLKIAPLTVKRENQRLIASCVYCNLDITYKKNRYTSGGTSVYVTTLDTHGQDQDDFEVPSGIKFKDGPKLIPTTAEQVDEYDEQNTEDIEDQSQDQPVTITDTPVAVAGSIDKIDEDQMTVIDTVEEYPVQQILPDENPPPTQQEFQSKDQFIVAQTPVPKKRFGLRNGGNGKPVKEDPDIPANFFGQNLGTPLTMNMEDMLRDFKRVDPSMIEEAHLTGRYAKIAINSVSPPPKKKGFNIWFAVGIVIIGVIAYQTVGNPAISGFETKQQAAEDAARAKASQEAAFQQMLHSPPVMTITSSPDKATRSTVALFLFSPNKNDTTTFYCSLDNQSYTPCHNPQQYYDLHNGGHIFQVKGVDSANRVGQPAAYQWFIGDNAVAPPTITPKTNSTGGSITGGGPPTGSGNGGCPSNMYPGIGGLCVPKP